MKMYLMYYIFTASHPFNLDNGMAAASHFEENASGVGNTAWTISCGSPANKHLCAQYAYSDGLHDQTSCYTGTYRKTSYTTN